MSEFVKVARVSDIPDPGKDYFEVDDRLVVLFRIDDSFYCLDDVCTHDGGPLGEGFFKGHTIACPRHGAQFDIRSGQALTMPATESTVVHEVKVEDGDVWIRVRDV
jgi:3-phenylpropionate/trans-cinnamate dioxygenase ferredoxin subunit